MKIDHLVLNIDKKYQNDDKEIIFDFYNCNIVINETRNKIYSCDVCGNLND